MIGCLKNCSNSSSCHYNLSIMPTLLSKPELCTPGAAPGYVLDTIRKKNITAATEAVQVNIKKTTTEIENLSKKKISKIYIGKSYINKKKNYAFDPDDTNTWKRKGISDRCRAHVKESYGRNGLIVLAVVTKDSIPEDCIDNRA